MDPITKRTNGNQLLEIYHDEEPENPREWSNMGIMVCDNDKYKLGDIQVYSKEEYESHMEDEEKIVELPLYLYDHSGLSISTVPNPFDVQQWDTSNVGIIYTTPEKIKEMHGDKEPTKEKIIEQLVDEIKTYDRYLKGEVYRFVKSTIETCSLGEEHKKTEESCGGFYDIDDIIDENNAQEWIES